MPKHIIEFNIPEENEELKTTMDAGKFVGALYDLSSELRGAVKYDSNLADAGLTSEQKEKIREWFHRILEENEVQL